MAPTVVVVVMMVVMVNQCARLIKNPRVRSLNFKFLINLHIFLLHHRFDGGAFGCHLGKLAFLMH